MAIGRRCEVCGRGAMTGHSRSKSNIATKRKQHINLQTKRIDGKKIRTCTKCIKTANKNRTKVAA